MRKTRQRRNNEQISKSRMTSWLLELMLLDYGKLRTLVSGLDLAIQIITFSGLFGLKSFRCLNVSFYSPSCLTSDLTSVPELNVLFWTIILRENFAQMYRKCQDWCSRLFQDPQQRTWMFPKHHFINKKKFCGKYFGKYNLYFIISNV